METDLRYRRHMSEQERELRAALVLAKGSPTRAAQLLGVSRMTVWRWMQKYGIEIRRTAA